MSEDIKKWEDIEHRANKDLVSKRATNFVFKLANEIYTAKKIIDYDVALTCASSLISSCVPHVRLTTSIGPMPLNEMNIIVGASGTGKTLPFRIVQDIIEEISVLFPGRYTVEGVEKWFARRPIDPDTGEERTTGPYVNPPYCTIVTDEISQSFKETKKEYMSGSIELLSQLYDGRLKGTALSSGPRQPQHPLYVNMLGATVPEFLPDLPKFVFEQGMAGRIYWLFIEPKDEAPKFEIMDYKSYNSSVKNLKAYSGTLQRLFDINIHANPDRKIFPIRLSSDASILYKFYHDKKYREWQNAYENRPFDFDWQYKRRLHELVLKKSGIFAIGSNIEFIKETASFNNIRVNKEDMTNAIRWVEKSEYHLQNIIFKNKTGVVYSMNTSQAMFNVYSVKNLIRHLLEAPNNTLNNKQLWSLSKIADYRTYRKYRDQARANGLIIDVPKSKISKEKEKQRLEIEKGKNLSIFKLPDNIVEKLEKGLY